MIENVEKQACEPLDIDLEILWEKNRKRRQRHRTTSRNVCKYCQLPPKGGHDAMNLGWSVVGSDSISARHKHCHLE